MSTACGDCARGGFALQGTATLEDSLLGEVKTAVLVSTACGGDPFGGPAEREPCTADS
jgi:hypothetical protein